MGSKGQRGRNRGRGRGGRRGGAFGGSGGDRRHGNQIRPMHPSIYESTACPSMEDDGEDFLIFGQFDMATDSDSDDLADGRSKHSRRKAKIKKNLSKRSCVLEELASTTTLHQHLQPDSAMNTNTNNNNNNKSAKSKAKNISKASKLKGKYSNVSNTSTHFVRSTAQWNDTVPELEDSRTQSNDYSNDDGNERDVDLDNLHLDIGNLDINNDDLIELALEHQQTPYTPLPPSLACTNTSNESEDSDSNCSSEDGLDQEQQWTDRDIMQIIHQHGDDNDAIRDYLDGLTMAQLDRLDIFFEQRANGLVGDDNGDTEENDHDDALAYEEHYSGDTGLDDSNEISPNKFRISLEEALENVPAGLKPGVRNWMSHDKKEAKRQKQLEKKERKKEAKAKRQPNKDKAKRGGPVSESFELLKIDSRIRDFINDNQLNSYQFAPMSKNSRRQLHLLSTAYNLKSFSAGTGKVRTPIISKTERTFIPQDRRYIDRFIAEAQFTTTAQTSIARKKHQIPAPSFDDNESGKTKSTRKKKLRKERDQKQQLSLGNKKSSTSGDLGLSSHGTVVASNAAPITGSNVGHRLLTAMGWTEGSGLGSNQDGITDPIEAIIRGKRRGLGS